MRRDGALQLQDGDRADRVDQHHLRRHLGVHRADPGQHLHPQDAVGQLLVKNPYLEKLLIEKAKDSPMSGTRSSRTRRLGPAPRFPEPGGEGRSRPASRSTSAGCSNSRRPHALYRSGAVAEPVHPGRCREVGPAHAALPRVGAGHQVALLPALQIVQRAGFAGGVEADNTADLAPLYL
jgi:hypothetical protein